jgi:hypothetical protein
MQHIIKAQQEKAKKTLLPELTNTKDVKPEIIDFAMLLLGDFRQAQQKDLDILISQTVECTVEAVVETLLSKAKLIENPVDVNGELVDGSYYCIYKGDIQSLKDQVSNKTV